ADSARANTAASRRGGMPRSSGVTGPATGSGDPGRLVRARVVEDRGEVLGRPFLADLAVLEPVEIDRVPLEVTPGGGNAEQGALLRTGHDQADDDLVAVAADVLHVGVQIGRRADGACLLPRDVRTAREVSECACRHPGVL